MKISIGADHAGWKAKENLKRLLEGWGHQVVDMGTHGDESVDYPDFAFKAAEAVQKKQCDRGILICSTGVGMSMAANKIPGVRAALCQDPVTAEFSRRHNDANVLCLGARVIPQETMAKLVEIWLTTPFEGGRHGRRIEKIHQRDNPSASSEKPS